MKLYKLVISLLFISLPSYAWVPSGEISYIKEVVTYGSDSSVFLFQLESGLYCYLPNVEGENKKAFEVIMSMKNFSKKGEFYCHDKADSISGYTARRLHRVTQK